MSDARDWLERTIPSAPEELRAVLANALRRSPNEETFGVAESLARAARELYAQVLTGTGGREDALVLLAADALFTHAFQARAEEDPLELAEFAGRWGGRGVIGRLAEDTTEESMDTDELAALLESLRGSEKDQALFYRGLAARAEEIGDVALAQRFHGLHADEQHHLSRLTARLLELGNRPANLDHIVPTETPLEEWETVVPERENAELARYRGIPAHELDEDTRQLIEEILSVERRHLSELDGKWTMA